MIFYKIQISKWRDKSAPRRASAIVVELSTLDRSIAAGRAGAERQQASAETEAAAAELKRLQDRRTQILADEERQAETVQAAAQLHPMASEIGYQVVSADGSLVVALVDKNGDPFPASALIEYDIVDINPPLPSWADAKWPDPPPKQEAPLGQGAG